MTPFQQALLAIDIAVDALHEIAKASPGADPIVCDAFDQLRHLGFDTRPTTERHPTPERHPAAAKRKPVQHTLFR
jgi:hypothetical protein